MCIQFSPGGECCGCIVRTIPLTPDFLRLLQVRCLLHTETTETTETVIRTTTQVWLAGVLQSQTVTYSDPVTTTVETESDETTDDTLAGQFEFTRTDNPPNSTEFSRTGDYPASYTDTYVTTIREVVTTIVQQARSVLLFDASDMPWFGEQSRGEDIIRSAVFRVTTATATMAGFTRLHDAGGDVRGILVDDDGPLDNAAFDAAYAAATSLLSLASGYGVKTSANIKSHLPATAADTLAVMVFSSDVHQGVLLSDIRFAISDTSASGIDAANWKHYFTRADGVYTSMFRMPKQPFQIDARSLAVHSASSPVLDFFDAGDREMLIEFLDATDDDLVIASMRYYSTVSGADWWLSTDIEQDTTIETIVVTDPQETSATIPWTGFYNRYREDVWEFSSYQSATTLQRTRQTEVAEQVLYNMQPFFLDAELTGTRLRITPSGEHHPLASIAISQIQNPALEKNPKCVHAATFPHGQYYHHQRFRVEEITGEFLYEYPFDSDLYAVTHTLAEEEWNGYIEHFHYPASPYYFAAGIDKVAYLLPLRIEEEYVGSYGYQTLGVEIVVSVDEGDDANYRVHVWVLCGYDYRVENVTTSEITETPFPYLNRPVLIGDPYTPGEDQYIWVLASKLVPRWETEFPPIVEFDEADIDAIYHFFNGFDTNGDGVIDANDSTILTESERYPSATAATRAFYCKIRPAI